MTGKPSRPSSGTSCECGEEDCRSVGDGGSSTLDAFLDANDSAVGVATVPWLPRPADAVRRGDLYGLGGGIPVVVVASAALDRSDSSRLDPTSRLERFFDGEVDPVKTLVAVST